MKKLRTMGIMAALFLLCGITALAGSINEHEQRVLDTVSTPVNYDGKEYVAKETYVDRLAAYMNQDNVDLTESQADKAIDKFYDSIATGISEGYMVPVEPESSEEDKNPGKDDGNQGGNQGGSQDDGNNEDGNKDENNDSSTDNGEGDGINSNTDKSQSGNAQTGMMTDASGNDATATGGTDTSTTGTVDSNASDVDASAEGELSEEEITRLQKERDLVNEVIEKYSLAEEEADVYAELEEAESKMAQKDYSDAEPYQNQISLGLIAVVIVVAVAAVMIGIIFWHKHKSYRK